MNLWFIPPRVLTVDILKQEYFDTAKLVNQITDKYDKGRFTDTSPLMRRFYRYQKYVYLRNKIIGAQIHHEAGELLPHLPQSLIRFGDWYYTPSDSLIQQQCEEIFDLWQKSNNTQKLSEFSILTTNDIHKELQFLFEIYKEKYQL